SFGELEADALVDTTTASSVGLRVRWGDDRDAWVKKLGELAKGATIRAGRVSPLAIVVHGGRDPEKMASYGEGRIAIQEEGAQVVTLALGASAGETGLGACAGGGNQTALPAGLLRPPGPLVAA